ncbi:MAG: MFS transporter [Steroidobacteraceae bacterium]|jgi:MFS family permease|nr:MFS transporter [Steroidobacteraceae bacterium]
MYYGWRIVAVAVLAMALTNGLSSYSYGLLVLPLAEEFGAGRMETMWGMTAASVTSILISPVAGSLMDRRSARVLLSIGAVCLALAFASIASSRRIWHFVIAFGMLVPLGSAFLGPIGTSTLVTRWFSRHRGRALGLTTIGSSLGGLLAPPLLQMLIDANGWRTACLWLAGMIVLVMLPPVWLIIRNRPADLGLHPDGSNAEVLVPSAACPSLDARLPNLMRDAAFWRISLAVGAVMAAFTVILVSLAPFAMGHGIGTKEAALLISTVSGTGIAGKLLFSVFADRINQKWALLASLAMLGLPLVTLVLFQDYWSMLLAAVSVGMATGTFLPAWGALLARVFGPSVFGRVMGRMQPFAVVMVTVSTPLSGYLFDVSGSYSASFLTMAGVTALAFVVLLRLRMEVRPEDVRVEAGADAVRQ